MAGVYGKNTYRSSRRSGSAGAPCPGWSWQDHRLYNPRGREYGASMNARLLLPFVVAGCAAGPDVYPCEVGDIVDIDCGADGPQSVVWCGTDNDTEDPSATCQTIYWHEGDDGTWVQCLYDGEIRVWCSE
jgi:hypothetical protein